MSLVYVYWSDQVCIYVGQTDNLSRRDAEHRADDPWWRPDLDLRIIADGLGPDEVNRVEARAIALLAPVFNVQRPEVTQPDPGWWSRLKSDPAHDPGVWARYPAQWKRAALQAKIGHSPPRGSRQLPEVIDWSPVTEHLDCYTLKVCEGQTVESIQARQRELTTAMSAQRVTVLPVDHDPRLARMMVARVDPWGEPLPWVPPRRGATSVPFAENMSGQVHSFRIAGRHPNPWSWAIGGQTRAGKSVGLRAILLGLHMLNVTDGQVAELWGIDLKRGVEFGPLQPIFRRLALDEESAVELLQAAVDEMNARLDALYAEKSFNVHESEREWPAVVVAIDEAAGLLPVAKEAHPLLDALASRGLAAGVQLIVCTQSHRSANPQVVPALTSNNLLAALAYQTRDPEHTEKILRGASSSAPAHELTQPGTGFLVVNEANALPELILTRFVPAAHVPEIVRLEAEWPDLDHRSPGSESADQMSDSVAGGETESAHSTAPVNDPGGPAGPVFVPLDSERATEALRSRSNGSDLSCIACGSLTPWDRRGRLGAPVVVRVLDGGGGGWLAVACRSCVREQEARLVG